MHALCLVELSPQLPFVQPHTLFQCAACCMPHRWVTRPACKPLQCQACGHLSGVVRGARQLTGGGAATASGPAALSLADNTCFALNALFHALNKNACLPDDPHTQFMPSSLAFMQRGQAEPEVRASLS